MQRQVLFPGLAPQPPLPAAQNDDQFLALVSGLQFGLNGAEAPNTLAFQMMVDYVTGHLGSSQVACLPLSCPSVALTFCARLSIDASVCSSVYLSICLSDCLSVCLSMCLFGCLSDCVPVCGI